MENEPRMPGGGRARLDDEEAAARRVRELLAQHVPLALIADLTDDFPPTSTELLEAESPTPGRTARGGGSTAPRRRA